MILGDVSEHIVGGHLLQAANSIGLQHTVVNPQLAQANWLVDKVYWRLMDRRPPNIEQFERVAIETIGLFRLMSHYQLVAYQCVQKP